MTVQYRYDTIESTSNMGGHPLKFTSCGSLNDNFLLLEELCVFSYWEATATSAGPSHSTFPAKSIMSPSSTISCARTLNLNAASITCFPSSRHMTLPPAG